MKTLIITVLITVALGIGFIGKKTVENVAEKKTTQLESIYNW